jgi:tetratricopeptide (TPR) repeat protein
MINSSKPIRLQLSLYFGLWALMAALVFSLPWVFAAMSRIVPENFYFLATEALNSGNKSRAEEIVRERIQKEWYDFNAHYLLGEILAAADKPDAAAEVMKETLEKSRAIRGRVRPDQPGYSGFDEAKSVQRLARYLWAAGHWLSAAEVWRHALDLGSTVAAQDLANLSPMISDGEPVQSLARAILAIHTENRNAFDSSINSLLRSGAQGTEQVAVLRARWEEERAGNYPAAISTLIDGLKKSPESLLAKLALQNLAQRLSGDSSLPPEALEVLQAPLPSAPRRVAFQGFQLGNGASLLDGGVRMTRNGKIWGRTDTGMFRTQSIIISASGSAAFGQSPLLVVRIDQQEVGRLYLDGPQPTLRMIVPKTDGLPKVLDLELEFTNDAFDPISRADRDITIHGIWFN